MIQLLWAYYRQYGRISAAAAAFPTDVEEELSQLDEEFFAYPHNLTELLFAYVSDHPDEFGPLA